MVFSTLNDSSPLPMPFIPPELFIPRSVHFGLYIFILPCSLVCTLFLIYHSLANKVHRQALHNHPLIFLLVSGLLFETIDLPLQMDYLNLGYVRFQSSRLCLIWMFVEFWCHAANSLLLTWTSFERHILIFHHQCLSKHKYNKLVFHYLPLIILLVYLSIYYLVIIVFPPCSTIFDYHSQFCGFFPCFLVSSPMIAMWDAVVHNTVPTLLITLFNATLVGRVLWHKHQLHQPVRWKRYRKLSIQLLTISAWYLLIHFPMMLNVCLLLTGSNNLIVIGMGPYLAYLSYYCILLMPFVYLISMWKDIKPFSRRRIVAPIHGTARSPNHREINIPVID